MTFTFGCIMVEERVYPRVIMGEDNFSGWFGKGTFATEEQRATEYHKALETAYDLGVRGFSISPQDTLVRTLRAFKHVFVYMRLSVSRAVFITSTLAFPLMT